MNKSRKSPTKEQKAWMKKTGYTEEQLDNFWKENINTNPVIKNLDAYGITWRDMHLSFLRKLSVQKEEETQLKIKKESEEKEIETAIFYFNRFPEFMLKKIDQGKKLSKKELSILVFAYEIETTYGETQKWSRSNISIIDLIGRYFLIEWKEGLVEYQENKFYNQPIEVVKKTYEKTITVTEWVKKT